MSAIVEFVIISVKLSGGLVDFEIPSDLSASKSANNVATRVLTNFTKDRDANEGGSC